MIDILILAIISAVILYKLYTMLGQDNSDDIAFKYTHMDSVKDVTPACNPKNNLYENASYAIVNPNSKLAPIIKKIRALDPYFTEEIFTQRAKKAFEIILKAFSNGDKTLLRSLLDHDVYNEFASNIDLRQQNKQFPETTLVSIISADIISGYMNGSNVEITIKFITEQINIVRNNEGKIILGNPSQINRVEDNWTFSRDIQIDDPTWKLVATNNS